MIVRAARSAAAVLCLAAFFLAPARAQLVQERGDNTAATTAIELWFRAPAAGYDLQSPGIARMALAAVAASRPAGGNSSISEMVTRLGGTLTLEVYPDICMVGVSVPAAAAPPVLSALRSAYLNPFVSAAGIKAAAQDSAIAAASGPFDSARLLQDALFAQLFSSGPAHYAPIPDASAFAKLTQQAVQAFATRAFARNTAILSLAGNVGPALLALARPNGFVPGDAQSMTPPLDSTLAPAAGQTSISGRAAGVGLAWAGPPISDTRSATAMDFISDYLFDPDRGVVTRALRSQADIFSNGQFVTMHDPGVLLVTLSGQSAAASQQTVLDAISALQEPLDAASFAAARQAFLYHIMSQTQTPLQRADNAGWYAAEGNAQYAPGDASGTYVQAAGSLDPQFIAQVARKYLQRPVVVRLIESAGAAPS
jgi:predicted Zn-dependent peptidase